MGKFQKMNNLVRRNRGLKTNVNIIKLRRGNILNIIKFRRTSIQVILRGFRAFQILLLLQKKLRLPHISNKIIRINQTSKRKRKRYCIIKIIDVEDKKIWRKMTNIPAQTMMKFLKINLIHP